MLVPHIIWHDFVCFPNVVKASYYMASIPEKHFTCVVDVQLSYVPILLVMQWSIAFRSAFHRGKENILWIVFSFNESSKSCHIHRMKSHLSVDWMVTEWWLNGDWKVTGKVDFSHRSVTIQSTEWQAHFNDLSVTLFFEK